MPLQKWSRIKPLVNPKAIVQLEQKYGFSLSEDLKKCVISNNGARPKPNTIVLKNGEENDVKILLSYNDGDPENIYKVIEYFMKNYNGTLIPFATDSAGNYYCEQNEQHIILWTQNDERLPVCDSFLQFLESLYDLK